MITLLAIALIIIVPTALVRWARGDQFATRSAHTVDLGRPEQTWSSALGWHS